MGRAAVASALLLLVACAPDPVPEEAVAEQPVVALEPAPPADGEALRGVVVRPGRSGGRAKRRRVGELELSGLGHLGGRGGAGYGIGLGGMGGGGAGGGVGFGSGLGRLGHDAADGEQQHAGVGERLEVSPFAYAEIALPYAEGAPGRFHGRPDARIEQQVETARDMLSTFAVDVDTAAYSIARRSLLAGRRPERTLVRVEELVNAFHYDYDPPRLPNELFSIQADGTEAPGSAGKYLLRLGLQARSVSERQRPPVNLVFLVDTSGSMSSDDRLPLARRALAMAVERLGPQDRVAISTYAGGVSLILPPTPGDQQARIHAAIASLKNGGGTAMASGLRLAYQQAARMLGPRSVTRIIVCSDGDANIGATRPEEMLAEVQSYVSEGVFLSTIGFGDGNYQDATMEQLADKGNGNYFYVDSERQAQRVFSDDLFEMLIDVAQDVKIQVSFDAQVVKRYRLVGYENRAVKDEDFRNDRVDGGEIGAGHQVTALYELELAHGAWGELAKVHVRAKQPRGMTAKEHVLAVPVALIQRPFSRGEPDYRFAVAVMGVAEVLRGNTRPGLDLLSVRRIAADVAEEPNPRPEVDRDRRELLRFVDRALELAQSGTLAAR